MLWDFRVVCLNAPTTRPNRCTPEVRATRPRPTPARFLPESGPGPAPGRRPPASRQTWSSDWRHPDPHRREPKNQGNRISDLSEDFGEIWVLPSGPLDLDAQGAL